MIDDIRRSDVLFILKNARDLPPEYRWEARFRLWGPGCDKTAVSFQCCFGDPVPDLKGWTVADKLEHRVARTGIITEKEAEAFVREQWARWVDSEEVRAVIAYEEENERGEAYGEPSEQETAR